MLVSWRRSRRDSSSLKLTKDLSLCRQHVENTLNLEILRHLDQEDGFVQIQRSVQSWMWNSVLTKDVIALISWSNHCLETKQFHGFEMWMVSTNTLQKRQRKHRVRLLTCLSARGNPWQRLKPKPRSVVNSNFNVPIPERKWIDIDPQPFDRCCFEVSEFTTRTLRHDASIPREEDGAVRFDDLINKLKEEFCFNSLALGGRKQKRFQYCLNPYFMNKFLYFRAIEGHSGEHFVDPLLQDNILVPDDFAEYIYHVGNAYKMHFIIQTGLVPGTGGTDSQCSSLLWTRRTFNLIEEKLSTIWINPESNRTNKHGDFITRQFFVQFTACGEKGIAILSNSIARNHSFRHTTSDSYRQSGMHENKERILLQNIQVAQVTTSDTCAELPTRSEGSTCSRIEKIPWSWERSAQGNLWQWILYWCSNPWHSTFRCWISWDTSKRKSLTIHWAIRKSPKQEYVAQGLSEIGGDQPLQSRTQGFDHWNEK